MCVLWVCEKLVGAEKVLNKETVCCESVENRFVWEKGDEGH